MLCLWLVCIWKHALTSTEGEIFQSHHRLLIFRELPFDSLSRIPDWIIPHRDLPRSVLLVSSDLLVCLTAIFRYLQTLMSWKIASNVWFDYFRSVCTVGIRKMNWYLNVKGHEEYVEKWTKKNQQEQQEWRRERERLGSWRKSEKVPAWLRYESRSESN